MYLRLTVVLALLGLLATGCASTPAGPAVVATAAATNTPAASPKPAPPPSPAALQVASPAVVASPPPIASPSPSPAAAAVKPGIVRFAVVPAESEVAYLAREKLADRPLPSDAVGKTKDVSGTIELDDPSRLGGRVVDLKVDLRTLTSESNRRDNFIRENNLESNKYPFAEFTSDSVVAASGGYREGEEVNFKLPGRLKVHDTERPIVWDATAKLQEDTLNTTAKVAFKMSDFSVQPPRLAILTVEDDMRLEVKLTAKRS